MGEVVTMRKGEIVLCYDDGYDKMKVSFNVDSEYVPESINVECSSDSWIYVDANDVDWLISALQQARGHIRDALRNPDA